MCKYASRKQLSVMLFAFLFVAPARLYGTESRLAVGEQVYHRYCILCHGEKGEGDGRMAKIIKDPPPANLVLSRMPDGYLIDIISRGGKALKRSPQMPSWKEQLNRNELLATVEYIKTLRE